MNQEQRIAELERQVAELCQMLQEWMLLGETLAQYQEEHTVH